MIRKHAPMMRNIGSKMMRNQTNISRKAKKMRNKTLISWKVTLKRPNKMIFTRIIPEMMSLMMNPLKILKCINNSSPLTKPKC